MHFLIFDCTSHLKRDILQPVPAQVYSYGWKINIQTRIKMKLHLPTGLLTVAISAMSLASASDYYFTSNQKLGDLTDVGEITILGSNVEVDSVNGGEGVMLTCYSQREIDSPGGPAPEVVTDHPATFKVNSNLVLNYTYVRGIDSSNVVTITADDIKSDSKLVIDYAKLQALTGNVSIAGKLYDDGFISKSSVTNTDLIAENGSVNIGAYLTMEGGTIAAANDVNITNSTVTVNGLSAQNVNINEKGKLNIEDAGRVELGEVAVGAGASLGVNGATLVLNEGSSITLAEGATLTAFDNVSLEFIMDADSAAEYSFDVFVGIDNLTDEASLAIIKEFEQALTAGDISISLKSMTADGELIELDAASAEVTFTDGTLSIGGTLSVPEPTTATLSLLALAALAARRRRH